MTASKGDPAPSGRLAEIADAALRSTLDRDPVEATYLGDHRHDAELPDPSAAAAEARAAELRGLLAELDACAAAGPVDTDDAVDAAVLRTALAAELFDLEELQEAEWNPMVHNPGAGLHSLLARDFAPLADRLESAAGRLEAVPDYLAAARSRLGTMSRIHLDTARHQLAGTINLIDAELVPALDQVPGLRTRLEPTAARARTALAEQRRWLAEQAEGAVREPRLGPKLFAAKLALTLDTAFEPAALLSQAESELELVEARLCEQAARIAGEREPGARTVQAVLRRLADDAPTDATILRDCLDALAEATAFVRARDLVTVPDDPIAVVEMPELDRGVAVAYCRPNGPLEQAELPTEIAVSPTPADWSAERVTSFYREYNRHMLHGLTVHEAMPGHAVQLMHANRHRGRTMVRRVFSSGAFVEGWAVYAEQLMTAAGYRREVSEQAADALRMQQLKMQLRTVLNTVLDIRFHCDDLDERTAMALMCGRGHQEEGEAAGKWQRVQLSAAQLCTYYVGYLEVRKVAENLAAAHPDWSQRRMHDAMLAHGSPPPRHLPTLLGLAAHG
ncbi:MAG TPA: DUF885 domain-containing protein [Jatrophihabitans sp.]|nr:DUF885 domain-containing protein [Jatrophihabitans sp.]